MSAHKLYEIATEYAGTLALMEQSDMDEQTFTDTLESISGDMETKSTQVAFMIRNMEVYAASVADAAKAMTARAKAADADVKRLKLYLKNSMELCKITKITGPMITLSIQKNPAGLVVDDESQIPPFYWRQPEPIIPAPVIDNDAIRKAIADGEEVPGAHLVQATRLVIKA